MDATKSEDAKEIADKGNVRTKERKFERNRRAERNSNGTGIAKRFDGKNGRKVAVEQMLERLNHLKKQRKDVAVKEMKTEEEKW